MRATVPRKFTLVDAMVLIAAIGSIAGAGSTHYQRSASFFLPGIRGLNFGIPNFVLVKPFSLEPKNNRSMIETSACRQEAKHANRPIRSLRRQTAAQRRFTLVDAMVLIAATAIAFVPIRLFLWENWHFPEELSVPEIWRMGLEINVSLVPLALSLSMALWLLALNKPRPSLRRVFRKPGMAACTVTLMYSLLSSLGYLIFLRFSHMLDRGTFNDPDSAMLWIWNRACNRSSWSEGRSRPYGR